MWLASPNQFQAAAFLAHGAFEAHSKRNRVEKVAGYLGDSLFFNNFYLECIKAFWPG